MIGTKEGSILLYNLKSKKQIYRFNGWGSPVTTIEQSPVIDVVAIGLADGRIVMHNLKTDKTLFIVQGESEVTCLAFRTDGAQPTLVAGNKLGDLQVWDLEKQQLVTVIRAAHVGFVSSAYFYAGEAVLLTSGSDNALKVCLLWICVC